ncbi:hypothetical protein [Enterococcus larvae]|uniref:hypothetical protein n=1 Tax=Enterococcus larvae TaxID=2794352 RepID=UPI003F39E330
MIEHEAAVKFENHDQHIKSLERRMEIQEKQDETMRDLVISVKLLATNMENMLEEQKEQSQRLKKLEDEPADNWNIVKRTILTAIVSGLAGALLGFFL